MFFILSTIYLVIPVSGCVVMGPNELLCTEAYYAIKTTLPLIALLTCCWMSFEAVLGNKEFEFVVSKVTLTVVTRRSTSGGHGVSVIVSVTGSGSDSLEAQSFTGFNNVNNLIALGQ